MTPTAKYAERASQIHGKLYGEDHGHCFIRNCYECRLISHALEQAALEAKIEEIDNIYELLLTAPEGVLGCILIVRDEVTARLKELMEGKDAKHSN
jgi:hypothetical protein